MLHLYLKSFHIIGFVSWFAGLFYLVRMFVYHAEAENLEEPIKSYQKKQFSLMQERAYKIICNPAMMITWTCGIAMLVNSPQFLEQTWIQIKLVLVLVLTLYHYYCKKVMQKLALDQKTYNSFQFRLLNEFPTLFLVAIVLIAVLKNGLNFVYAFGGVLAFGFSLYFAAKAYKKHRLSKS